MKKPLQIIEYDNLIHKQIKEDRKIGEHIFLLDEYQLSPVRDYEFTAPENMFIEVLSGKVYLHQCILSTSGSKPGSFTPLSISGHLILLHASDSTSFQVCRH